MTDWRDLLVDDDSGLSAIFREAKTVAVLGAKADSAEPAYYVPAYLHCARLPDPAGQPEVRGPSAPRRGDRRVAPRPARAGRRDRDLPAPRISVGSRGRDPRAAVAPETVWFQLGIRNDGAAEKLARAGIRVVQDRCMMPEHRRLKSQGSLGD